MTRLFWNSLVLSPIGILAVLATSAIAAPVETSADRVALDQFRDRPSAPAVDPMDELDQVTSVSQLSDVKPTDWAFQALQSLVERYGCIVGYPDKRYRGNQALTRYEFAAGLNACMDRINELIAAGTANLIKKEDLASLQKLQEEFSAELVSLRRRVDALDTRTATLQKQQFSTTTKLNAEVVVAVAGIAGGQDATGNTIPKNTIVGDRVRLNLETSFTGEDLLRTRLQTTNLSAFSGTSTFTPEGDFRFGGGTFDNDNPNSVGIDALLYSFPLGKNTMIVIDANAGAIDDWTDTVNPFFDGDGGSGALSHFATRNPIYLLMNGVGAGIRHKIGDTVELSVGYLANDAANPQTTGGLFHGAYAASAQLTLKPQDGLTLGFTYIHSYNTDFTANGGAGSNRASLRSALLNNTNLPAALSPFATLDLPVSSNAFGVEGSFRISPKMVLNGSVGYTKTRTLSSLGGIIPRGDLDIWNWSVGLAFPDFLNKGSVAGILVGMEPKVTGVSRNLRSAIGIDSATSLHIEGFYQFALNDHIAITPGLIWLTSPDHNGANSDIVIGTIRTTFTF